MLNHSKITYPKHFNKSKTHVPIVHIFHSSKFYFNIKLRNSITMLFLSNNYYRGSIRMEKLDLKRVRYQAKLFGTIVTVVGAMLMTFYKGSVINFFSTEHGHQPSTADAAAVNHHNDGEFVKGSILLIIATLAWAAFFILQVITLRKYTAHLSLTTLVCFLGTLQAIVVTLALEHRPGAWAIGWDMNLLAAAYAVRKTTIIISNISLFEIKIYNDL